MLFSRVWAMRDAWTFRIRPIKELLKRYDVGLDWIDPFAGRYSPAEHTNDHNPMANSVHHMDVLDFAEHAKTISPSGFKGILLDPPYSARQVAEHYKMIGLPVTQWTTTLQFISQARKAFAPQVNEYAISFGWNSIGLGKTLGFEPIEILLVCHGGLANDTIVTVERRK